MDMDVICIKHFDLDSSFVFATERHGEKTFSAICIIKGEKSSLFLDELIKKSKNIIDKNDYIPNKTLLDKILKFLKLRKKRKIKTINWGIIGPKFLDQEIKNASMESFLVKPELFCEIDWFDAKKFIDPNYELPMDKNIYALHAWNATWDSKKQENSLSYDPKCLLEKLKKQYLSPSPINPLSSLNASENDLELAGWKYYPLLLLHQSHLKTQSVFERL